MKYVALMPVACLALMACGGSTRSSAFEENVDAAIGDSAAVANDSATVADEGVTPDGTGEVLVEETGTMPDTMTPKPDAPTPGCPSGMTTPPLKCPDICNGGCVADACRILCNGIMACGGRRIDCPPGMKCLVECSAVSSCGGLDLRCPETGACSLQCSGTSSCGSAQIRCPVSASCTVNCGGISSCGGGQVQCGAGACTAECPGGKLAKVNCGASCLCTNKC